MLGNIKFPVSDAGSAIGFAVAVILTIAAAKHIPGVKKLV